MQPPIDPQRRWWLVAGTSSQVFVVLCSQAISFWLKMPLLSVVLISLEAVFFIVCMLFASGIVKPGPLRVSLRDLFWLTLVVAVGIAWMVERVPLAREMKGMEGYTWYRFSSNRLSPAEIKRIDLRRELQSLTDEALRVRMKNAVKWWGDDEFDGCLAELTRRGDSEALKELHTRMYEKSLREFGGFETWPALTALRRSQKQRDPLQMLVEAPPKLNTRPLLIVNVQNVDVEQQPFVFQELGWQRSGREEQFRAYLTDASGKLVPDSNFDLVHTDYKYSKTTRYSSRIAHGEKNAAPFILDLRKYLSPPPTGRYQLHVIFSNHYIAGADNFDGYTICQSEPLAVIVENRVPPPRAYSAVYPVFILLALGAVAVCVSFFQRLRGQIEKAEPWQKYVEWRAIAALAIGCLLACGWLYDVRGLSAEIERLRPHDDADWSLTLAE